MSLGTPVDREALQRLHQLDAAAVQVPDAVEDPAGERALEGSHDVLRRGIGEVEELVDVDPAFAVGCLQDRACLPTGDHERVDREVREDVLGEPLGAVHPVLAAVDDDREVVGRQVAVGDVVPDGQGRCRVVGGEPVDEEGGILRVADLGDAHRVGVGRGVAHASEGDLVGDAEIAGDGEHERDVVREDQVPVPPQLFLGDGCGVGDEQLGAACFADLAVGRQVRFGRDHDLLAGRDRGGEHLGDVGGGRAHLVEVVLERVADDEDVDVHHLGVEGPLVLGVDRHALGHERIGLLLHGTADHRPLLADVGALRAPRDVLLLTGPPEEQLRFRPGGLAERPVAGFREGAGQQAGHGRLPAAAVDADPQGELGEPRAVPPSLEGTDDEQRQHGHRHDDEHGIVRGAQREDVVHSRRLPQRCGLVVPNPPSERRLAQRHVGRSPSAEQPGRWPGSWSVTGLRSGPDGRVGARCA
jgi:hypothetical protein